MIKINLLPKDARKRVGLTERIVLSVLALVIAIVVVSVWWSYLNGVIEQKQQEIAQTQNRLTELQKVIDEIAAFEAQRQALEQKLAVIAQLEKEQQLPVHFLDELYSTLVDDVWLMSFSQDGANNLVIGGTALSNPVLADYVRKLEKSPYFNSVALMFSQLRQLKNQSVRDFQITLRLNTTEQISQLWVPQPK